jgi:hypothetical protein
LHLEQHRVYKSAVDAMSLQQCIFV